MCIFPWQFLNPCWRQGHKGVKKLSGTLAPCPSSQTQEKGTGRGFPCCCWTGSRAENSHSWNSCPRLASSGKPTRLRKLGNNFHPWSMMEHPRVTSSRPAMWVLICPGLCGTLERNWVSYRRQVVKILFHMLLARMGTFPKIGAELLQQLKTRSQRDRSIKVSCRWDEN